MATKNSNYPKIIFHLVVVLNYAFTLWYDLNYVNIPALNPKRDMKFMKGRLKFLTIWDILLQAVFFTICFLNDIIGSNEVSPRKPPLIRRLKDLILPALAFPLALFVGSTFWGIYVLDRELIFPKALDAFFPSWLNHAMHTNIMLFIIIEMYTTYRKYPSRKQGITILSVFMLIYLIWVFIIKAYSDMWVYPILDVLNWPLRAVFFVGLLVFVNVLYLVGEKINVTIWGVKGPTVEKIN